MRTSVLVFLLLSLGAVTGAPAQDPGAERGAVVRLERDPDAPRRPFLLEEGSYTVREILDAAGEHLRRSWVVGDEHVVRQLEAVLDVRFPLHLDDRQLGMFLQRLLAHAQAFAVPLHEEDGTGVFQLLSLLGSRGNEVQETVRFVPLAEALRMRRGYELVMTIVPLVHANAQQLGMELRMFASTHNNRYPCLVMGTATGNALLLQGAVSRVAELAELAQSIDAVAEAAEAPLEQRVAELAGRISVLEKRTAPMQEVGGERR